MVAVATPMVAGNGPETAIDFDALDALVDFHLDAGTDAIVAVGTTGESATLSEDEHVEVIRRVVARAAGRSPVVAGTGANSTTEALRLTAAAREAGADACLLVTPYYNRPTQEGLYRHYRLIAESVDVPQILYNVPGRTACDLLPETVIRLASLPNIIGLKDATADLSRVPVLRTGCGPDFLLYSGDDATSLDFLEAGGDGVISVTANVAPRDMHALCVAARAGRYDEARAIDARLAALHRDLFIEANPIPTKWALAAMGRIAAGIRLPLTWLSVAHEARVRAALEAAGVPLVH